MATVSHAQDLPELQKIAGELELSVAEEPEPPLDIGVDM